MNKKTKEVIVFIRPLVMLSMVLIGIFIGSVVIENFSNKPECYITSEITPTKFTEQKCMLGYDKVSLVFFLPSSYYQCCQRPHYLLQTIEPTLFTFKEFCENVSEMPYMEEGRWINFK